MAPGRRSGNDAAPVTALSQYQRLEASGLWRPGPEAQRREVIVSLGEATLVITDRADRALAHWSLAAVERRRHGEPAIYAPGPDAAEELELDDATMIAAIDRVQAAVRRRRPRPGRLRRTLLLAGLAAVVATLVLWLPEALVRHTATVAPPATRAALDAALLERLGRLTGPACRTPRGAAALRKLNARLRGPDAGPLVVVPEAVPGAVALPGGTIVMNRALVEDYDAPEVAAGHVLAADLRAALRDPLDALLSAAGAPTALRLLTTGQVPPRALDAEAERLLAATPPGFPTAALSARFAGAGVSARPYAYARDVSGEATLALIEADPLPASTPPLMSDGEWVALQGICGN